MKFTPLDNQPNVSRSRFDKLSLSMRLDTRGFAHLSWVEQKLGHNEVHYTFWDGLQWAQLGNGIVGCSEMDVLSSVDGITLDDDRPIIVFARNKSTGSSLNTSYINADGWLNSEIEVSYDVSWIGVTKTNRIVEFSSSSGSIGSNSSSSSSSNSSSSSSLDSSSSSSSIDSSSSSSIDSSSSSSSSSYNDSNLIVCSYGEDTLSVYSVHEDIWRELGQDTFSIEDFNSIKIASCGDKVGFVYQDENNIKYNFFDVDKEAWSFSSFQTLQSAIFSGDLVDFDIEGYYREEDGVLVVAWMEDRTSAFYIKNVCVDSNGVEFLQYGSSGTVVQRSKNVIAGDYISYGFRKIALLLNDVYLPRIFVSGLETMLYEQGIDGVWTGTGIDICGHSDGIYPLQIVAKLYQDDTEESIRVALNNFGDIYYFEQSEDTGFDMVYPYLVIMNAERLFLTQWHCGELVGTQIPCTYLDRVGDILCESLKKVTVVIDDGEDPLCFSSSSSSSVSEVSSESSSTSESYSYSESYSESSSSEGYSSSSEGYSDSSSSSPGDVTTTTTTH